MTSQIDFTFFEPEHFSKALSTYRSAYRTAKPFPHVVIDNFLPLPMASRLADEFPDRTLASFQRPDNEHQIGKLGRTQDNNFAGVPAFTRLMLNEFNGKVFLDFLEKMTGIEGLIADSHFNGGALHQILPGGRLAIHADFNVDKRRKLDRRVNVLLYLNRDWLDEYGGHLELWDEKMIRCEAKISPVFNRCVIFNTTSTSFHGHPEPLQCPADRTRNSIALYHYTNGRPAEERQKPHSTLWRSRPNDGATGAKPSVMSLRRRIFSFLSESR